MRKPIDLNTKYGRAKFYASREWKIIRAIILTEKPFCEICLLDQIKTLSVEVHHIVSLVDAPTRCLDLTNLQSLCKPCHSILTSQTHLHGFYARSLKTTIVNLKWKENLLSIEYLKNEHNLKTVRDKEQRKYKNL